MTLGLCFSSSLLFTHQSVADLRGRLFKALRQVTLVFIVNFPVVCSPPIRCDSCDAWSAQIPFLSFSSLEVGVAEIAVHYGLEGKLLQQRNKAEEHGRFYIGIVMAAEEGIF